MGVEIERKFLVSPENFKNIHVNNIKTIKQGYLHNTMDKSIRIRVENNLGYLTVKGGASGISKLEYEYDIPVDEAEEMLEKLTDGKLIQKKRHIVLLDGKVWEVDVFLGKNSGLIIAEIELESEDEEIKIPDWCGQEVSTDPRYINAKLIEQPYQEW